MIERVAGGLPATQTEPRALGANADHVFRITVAYHGAAYAGWQVQPDAVTVQGVLERAAEQLNGEPTRILGAGRTDAGVHARGQTARLQTTRDLDADRMPAALNAFLPDDVAVLDAASVEPQFHPIRDALWKHYRYTLRVASVDDPFSRDRVYRVPQSLDIDSMREAASMLVGKRDFLPFQKTGSPRDTTVRVLRRLDVVREEEYIHLHLVANGFLYGMARNLAGTVLRVGRGQLPPHGLAEGLATLDRAISGPCLPAHGLCLMQVVYAEDLK